jgi:hypothetical protein
MVSQPSSIKPVNGMPPPPQLIPNKIGITPLEMAAYFGKPRMLNRLLVKTEESVIYKKQEKLHKKQEKLR